VCQIAVCELMRQSEGVRFGGGVPIRWSGAPPPRPDTTPDAVTS
jgi:hypothetical protein